MYVVYHVPFVGIKTTYVYFRADPAKTRSTYTTNPKKARVYKSFIRALFVCFFSKDNLLILNHVD